MSLETGVLLDSRGEPFYWHLPSNRSVAYMPDSGELWHMIWEHREDLSGFAHTHPGSGYPSASGTDLTTFAAIEFGLGRSLQWWILSEDQFVMYEYRHKPPKPAEGLKALRGEPFEVNPECCFQQNMFIVSPMMTGEPLWMQTLRDLSGYRSLAARTVPDCPVQFEYSGGK